MSRRKAHRHGLEGMLLRYAASRKLDLKFFAAGSQIRIHDSGYIAIDIWLTGKYHVVEANYNQLVHDFWRLKPRYNERGTLPASDLEFGRFMDNLFYAADALKEKIDEIRS